MDAPVMTIPVLEFIEQYWPWVYLAGYTALLVLGVLAGGPS